MEMIELIEIEKENNCIIFPLTKYFYRVGINRWNEPYYSEETVGYCGSPDRCCIDCYLCFTPICFVLDIASCFTFQCIKIK